MTRFLLTLDQAVDTVFAALREARAGETYVPRAPSATVANIAKALIGKREIADQDDRHPSGREDARDHGLRGGGQPLRAARARTSRSCRCCRSYGATRRKEPNALTGEFSSADYGA